MKKILVTNRNSIRYRRGKLKRLTIIKRRSIDLLLSLLWLPDPRFVPIRTVARRAPFRLLWAARKPLMTATVAF